MDDTYAALTAALRRFKRDAIAAAPTAAADDVIADAPLLQQWVPGNYTTGDVRVQNSYPYKCCQAHDSTDNPDWDPATQRALWVPYHAKSPKWGLPYVAPTGAHDAYQDGEYMVWTDGQIYRCNTDNTVWGPDTLPDVWDVAT